MAGFDIHTMLYMLPAILVGFTVHEFAHAWTAVRLGDGTPLAEGRLTLNPLRHIEPMGFILILIAGFGWAKPVRITPGAFRNPRRDEVAVSLAGPLANLLLAVTLAVVLKLVRGGGIEALAPGTAGAAVNNLLAYGIWINLMLAVFNLLPLPPLDGSHVVSAFIPPRYAFLKERYLKLGALVLVGAILLGYFAGRSVLPITPVTRFLFRGLLGMLGMT